MNAKSFSVPDPNPNGVTTFIWVDEKPYNDTAHWWVWQGDFDGSPKLQKGRLTLPRCVSVHSDSLPSQLGLVVGR
jgi:hypothetical protein